MQQEKGAVARGGVWDGSVSHQRIVDKIISIAPIFIDVVTHGLIES
jgi:hypothetical protein